MVRVALVAGPDPGHALPLLGVAAELRRRGHAVCVWTGLSHTRTADHHRVPIARLPGLDVVGAAGGDLGRLWSLAADMAPPLVEDLDRFRPDVVVADTLTRVGALAAARLGAPWAELVPHHLPDPAEDLPPVGLGRAPARTPWRRLDDRWIHRQQRRSLAMAREQADAAARRVGLPGWPRPTVRLVATLPALERPRARWPADAHVVGPLAVDPVLAPLRPPAGDAPLVLVSDSTASGRISSIAELARVALRHLDLRVVVTSGRAQPCRTGALVVGRGPHGPLLRQAAAAIVTGGGGLVGKALGAGVPLVVVPQLGDQFESAARLREIGVARVLGPTRLTPRRLRWALTLLLHDDVATTVAARLARDAARLGPSVAAALVERIAAGDVPRAAGPADQLAGLLSPPGPS